MALGTQGAEELEVLERDAAEPTVCGLLTGVFGGEYGRELQFLSFF